MDKLKLEEVGENEWIFDWPKSSYRATDLFFEALDYADNGELTKAKKMIKKAIELYPQHIDAIHHLSIMSDKRNSKKLNEEAVNIGLSIFPKEFNDKSKLEWGWTENRPFLRAYHNKGLIALDEGKTDEAIKLFNHILVWNPNDNQGIRNLLADIYVKNSMWDEMVDLSDKYPEDCDPSMNFGLAIAHYKKDNKEKATEELKKANNRFPLCGAILLEDNPKQPKSEMHGCITYGGSDQAYEFWKEQGSAWRDSEVRNWLKSVIK